MTTSGPIETFEADPRPLLVTPGAYLLGGFLAVAFAVVGGRYLTPVLGPSAGLVVGAAVFALVWGYFVLPGVYEARSTEIRLYEDRLERTRGGVDSTSDVVPYDTVELVAVERGRIDAWFGTATLVCFRPGHGDLRLWFVGDADRLVAALEERLQVAHDGQGRATDALAGVGVDPAGLPADRYVLPVGSIPGYTGGGFAGGDGPR
ncbi:PH domain-containing protein [Haloarchaeobius amylolyticus]|uniref:PH domain-containing protein n=1 Tax=Haloarchaeobius amylolyticus TaxID=1198296 RepID=UPI002270378C|nr:PH domain-containing protein [Haloarchaeobius amylolyticus]